MGGREEKRDAHLDVRSSLACVDRVHEGDLAELSVGRAARDLPPVVDAAVRNALLTRAFGEDGSGLLEERLAAHPDVLLEALDRELLAVSGR